MKRTLYLHIGNHKTGTTSIQEALVCANDPRVFNQHRATKGSDGLKRWFGNSWVKKWGKKVHEGAGIYDDLPAALGHHNPQGDVIFSAEDLSWVFDAGQIKNFEDALRPFFEKIYVIAYLRRQDRNAVSLYQQGLTDKNTRIGRFMGTKAVSLPDHQPHFDRYFDYSERLGKWADAFGDEALKLFVYGDVIEEGDAVHHFSKVANIALTPAPIFLRKSMPKALQLLYQRIYATGLEIDIPRDLAEMMIDGEKTLPPRERAESFYAKYKQSNQALQKRFMINDREFVFNDDFSEYPIEGNEDWDHVATEQVLDLLLYSLAKSHAHERVLRQRVGRVKKRLNRVRSGQEALAKAQDSQ